MSLQAGVCNGQTAPSTADSLGMGPTFFLNQETGLDLLQLHPLSLAHVAEDLDPNWIQTFSNGKNYSDFLDEFPKVP